METQSTHDLDDSYHYKVIRRAIDRIDASDAPISLEGLSSEMGMSSAHFQRVFSRWVGVSPKRYQQFLSLEHAKGLLRDRFTTLAAADEAGLSGGGRLHDLFVRWEAMSPGNYAKGGKGLVIRFGWFATPFGRTLAMGTDIGLCGVAFAEEFGDAKTWDDMQARWPAAEYVEDAEALRAWVDAAFDQTQHTKLHLIGAPFQIKVWEALLQIPSGHVTTYSEIAQAVGSPKAVRAVGTAVGKNPVSWIIPCHRALRKSGGLGGYHWGLPVKRAMLAYEAARLDG